MEERLGTVVDLIEICLNFLVLMCLEVTACFALPFLRTPYGYAWLTLLFPVCFYAARRWIENSLLCFLALHVVVLAGMFWTASFFPDAVFWKILYLAVGILYAFLSIKMRVTVQKDSEGEIAPIAAGVVAAATFLGCSYLNAETGCMIIVRLIFAWLLGYLLKHYLRNFIHYLVINKSSAGAMPRRDIFRMGLAAAGGYSCFSTLLLILCTRSSFIETLSRIVRRLLWLLMRGIAWLLSLFGGEAVPEEAIEDVKPQAAMDMGTLGAAAEPSVLARILEEIVMVLVMLLAIAGVVFLVVSLARFIMEGYYGREKKKKEIREEGFFEEQERLESRREKRAKERLPVFLGSPAMRVRRAFRRTVQKTAVDRKVEIRRGKTARELAELSGGMEGTVLSGERERTGIFGGREGTELSGEKERTGVFKGGPAVAAGEGPSGDWEKLLCLYEGVRYGNAEPSREEAKEADKLSRQILHTIR